MIITIDSLKYKVKDNEYDKINHIKYNNLKLYKELGEHERLIGFIKKCQEINTLRGSFNFFSFKTTHGGFIPINLYNSNVFNKVYIIDTENTDLENINYNILNHNIQNINFSYPEIIDDNLSVIDILFIQNSHNHFNNYLKNINSKNFIAISKNSYTETSSNSNTYKLLNSEYYIHVSNNITDKFYEKFSYYINQENKEINFDNLINLCIMVKNAGPQFEDMLLKNLPVIDKWTILDTGSTDETIDIINKILVGKKEGKLYQEPFINFRDSRNRLLDLAGTTCKYNLMLDDTYIIMGNLRDFLTEVRSDQYSNSFTLFIHSDDTKYGSNRITKSICGLRYIHKIHEVISDKDNINVVIPENKAYIFDGRFDYMEKRTFERKQLDLKLLYEEVEENPNDPRAYYYLAQTYNNLEDYEKAFFYFMKRCEFINAGFLQERVDAAFEASRIANFKLNKPWSVCEKLYMNAFKIDETRPESLYFIGIHYYLENKFDLAYNYFKQGFEIGFPEHCQYSLKPTLSYHFLPKFLSKLCYQIEDYELGFKASELFLLNNKSDADDYKEIVSWYKIYEKLIVYSGAKTPKIPDKPVFCFVADGGFSPWSGSNITTTGVGGSETFIIEIARYIKKQNNFDVYVFCNTPGEKDENFEGVNYRHLNKYYEFINTNYVKHCIISRFSEYLPLTFKGFTENVYFIIHDLTPSGIVIPIDLKLKNIFCLTEWHVEYFTNIFPQLKSITVPFYYGIDNKFKLENVKKIKNKFIYSSFPNRGLLQLLQMWPKIYEKEPTSTLHIYSDVNNKWSNDVEPEKMKQIRNLLSKLSESKYGIFYHGWVNKQELAKAWTTSDIWFYPCTFMETFCLTALEAASSRTFVVTNDLAALQNTVGNRGAIIRGDPTTEDWQNEALNKLFYYMTDNNNNNKQDLINENFSWAKNLSWENQALKLLNISNKNQNINDIIKIINTFNLISDNDYHFLKIGAYKGNVYNDATFDIINKNTKAIFVEPVPSYYYQLKENYNNKYPNNKYIFLNNAVSDKEEKIQIYYPSTSNNFQELPWWIEQIASSSIKHCHDHGYKLDLDVINVNAITVKQIIDYCNIKTLFCLMIDTEGSDFKILMSINFSEFKPLYIVFENMHLTSYHNPGPNYSILINYLAKFGYNVISENKSDTLVSLL